MLPKPPTPQTLAGMKADTPAYETAKKIIQHQALLIQALGPGDSITGAQFSNSQGVSIGSLSGTIKRGKASFSVAPGASQNPTMFLAFPKGMFTSDPFAQVTRNGGTGTLPYTYTESKAGIIISLAGAPVAGTTYAFNWSIQE